MHDLVVASVALYRRDYVRMLRWGLVLGRMLFSRL
jgi:hypothetical protein